MLHLGFGILSFSTFRITLNIWLIDISQTFIIEIYRNLPATSQTAQLIAAAAQLEEISEAAEREGLTSVSAMLVEAEQEGER